MTKDIYFFFNCFYVVADNFIMKKLLLILFLNIALCTFSLNFSELRGIVLDSRTLEPVKNAKVFVEDEIAFTDINGEFYVQALLSGANLVRIEKQMYEEYSKVVFSL